MRLYFLRHGLAGDREHWPGDDAQRPLTDEGKSRIKAAAKAMRRLGLDIDAILTSPLKRAKQTATIVAEVLGLAERLVEEERLGPGFNRQRLAGILADRPEVETLMLVGHEPSFSMTIGEIIGNASIELKKGGLACLELSDLSEPSGTLLWLVPPKLLTLD